MYWYSIKSYASYIWYIGLDCSISILRSIYFVSQGWSTMSVSQIDLLLVLKRPYNKCVSPKCNYLYTARYRFSIKINGVNLEFDGKISLYLRSSINFWKILHKRKKSNWARNFSSKKLSSFLPLCWYLSIVFQSFISSQYNRKII